MIDEETILTAERLRDDITDFRNELRRKYPLGSRQVAAANHRKLAARFAEIWLIELAPDQSFGTAIGPATLADLNVHFQRLLTYAEHATLRSRYDIEIKSILDNYSSKIVIPIKQARGRTAIPANQAIQVTTVVRSAFVGQSFLPGDKRVNQCVADTLDALGIKAVTGEKPKADSISEKVKQLIEEQSVFVGIFTRRDKIARKNEWTTSAWVIDEKAYALGRQKRLILLKEQGVGSVGGIQGDYEYLEFSRESLESLPISLIRLFDLINKGLRK